jgi:hypothetical protein
MKGQEQYMGLFIHVQSFPQKINSNYVQNCLQGSLMMEAVRTSEKSVDNHFTRQYIPEDNSEHHTRRRENLKSHKSNIT